VCPVVECAIESEGVALTKAAFGHHGIEQYIPSVGHLRRHALKFITDTDQDGLLYESAAQETKLTIVKAGAEAQSPSVHIERNER
jgi:hypothetical protein